MRFQTVLFAFMLVLTAGCNAVSQPQYPTWQPSEQYPAWQPSDSASCAGPCWHGLVVGQSSEAEVLNVLHSLPFLSSDGISESSLTCCVTGDESNMNPGTHIVAYYKQPASLYLEAGIYDGVFTGLEIKTNSKFTVEQAVGTIGSPTYVGFQLEGAETIYCDINLIWESKQLVLTSHSESDAFSNGVPVCDHFQDTHKIKKSLIITEVRYKTVRALRFLFDRQPTEYVPYDASILEQ